jgi:hypothetical protein
MLKSRLLFTIYIIVAPSVIILAQEYLQRKVRSKRLNPSQLRHGCAEALYTMPAFMRRHSTTHQYHPNRCSEEVKTFAAHKPIRLVAVAGAVAVATSRGGSGLGGGLNGVRLVSRSR